MSEELKHGIPKAICIGETKYTKEEREKHDRDFEKILKTYKILGENETIKHEEQYEIFRLITNIYLEQIKTLQHTLPKPKAVF